MDIFTVADPNRNDATFVAENLRASDLIDVRAATSMDPVKAVLLTYERAHRRYGYFHEGECFAIAGIEWSGRPGEASAWLLGTPVLDRLLANGGLKASRREAGLLLRDVPCAFNFVPASNLATLRWLEWLGFKVVRALPNFRGLGVDCVEVRRGAVQA